MRRIIRALSLFFIILLVSFNSSFLYPQQNIDVLPADPAYGYLNDLRAWGLITTEISGTKPYTRFEFARLVLEAKSNLNLKNLSAYSSVLISSIDYLSDRFAKEIAAIKCNHGGKSKIEPFQSINLGYFNHNSKNRVFPQRAIDAKINPFTAFMENVQLSEGQSLVFESSHAISFGSNLSLYYQGRILVDSYSLSTDNFESVRYYLKWSFFNINLLVGKESMVWGTSSRNNLMLSSNTGPIGNWDAFPLIQVSNRNPGKLPWIFDKLGPMRYIIFLSRLDRDRLDFAYPYFHGKRFNFKPTDNFEFGLSHSFILGGKDFPASFTIFDALAEAFLVRTRQNYIFNIKIGEDDSTGNIANHFGGFDFRVRIPGLRFTEVYGEISANSLNNNLRRLVTEHLGYNVGIFVPRLVRNGRLGTRMEYTHTSPIFYTGSTPFLSGFTFNRRTLGSDLGPSGDEFYLEALYRPTVNTKWSTFIDFQSRGIGEKVTENFTGTETERRVITGVKFAIAMNSKLAFTVDTRYQWIRAFAHQKGDNPKAYFTAVSLQLFDVFN